MAYHRVRDRDSSLCSFLYDLRGSPQQLKVRMAYLMNSSLQLFGRLLINRTIDDGKSSAECYIHEEGFPATVHTGHPCISILIVRIPIQ